MHFFDLSPYVYRLSTPVEGVRNVGWLEPGFEFDRGPVSADFMKQLEWVIATEGQLNVHVNKIRGYMPCNFCKSRYLMYISQGRFMLGMSELWIPELEQGRFLAAPSLIYHYINDHQYQPPDVFVRSIVALTPAMEFNGEDTYQRLTAGHF